MWKVAQKVSLEPIHGNLFSGVPIRKLVFDNNKLAIKFPAPKNLSLWLPVDTIREFSKEEGSFIFNMVSTVRHYSSCKVDTSIWKPFIASNCKIEPQQPYYSILEKVVRVTQPFKITGKINGMFQFMCLDWRVKFNDHYYTRNDILTVVYGKIRPDPWPSYQNVTPDEIQTFVPVTEGTKVNVLVNKERQAIDSPSPGSHIELIGETSLDYSFQHLGSPLCVNRYRINEHLCTSDSLFVAHRKWQGETEVRAIVFVPYQETREFRYLTVKEPFSVATVLTQGCNAVKLITRSKLPVRGVDNCPVAVNFSSKIGDLFCYTIRIQSICPLIIIDKKVNEIEIRCPF